MMRVKAVEIGFTPIVPPKRNRKLPWAYNKEHYKRSNEIERYFLRIKRFRKIFTRYDKLDQPFCGIIYFAMIVDDKLERVDTKLQIMYNNSYEDNRSAI